MDSSGMLIFTQNGTHARALVGGDGKVEKEYHVTVSRQQNLQPKRIRGDSDDAPVVTEKQLSLLRHGLQLDGRRLRPALVDVMDSDAGFPCEHQRHVSQSVRRKPKRSRNRNRQHAKLRSSRNVSRNARHGRHFSRLSRADSSEGSELWVCCDAAGVQPTAKLRFVLREGRYRQIRRMCDAVGLEVHRLHRVRIGKLMLGSLSTGFWRFASETDIAELTYSAEADSDGDVLQMQSSV